MEFPDPNLIAEAFWWSALVTMLIDLVLVSLLLWRIKPTGFRVLKWKLVGTSIVFWAIFGTVLLRGFWDSYYRYSYPDSARWLGAVNVALYGVIGFALWWLSTRVPGNPIATFCLLGGVEGLLEHLWGIYGLGILDKTPMFQNANPLSVLVFSFFEYVFYWGVVLGIAALLQSAWRQWTSPRNGKRAPLSTFLCAMHAQSEADAPCASRRFPAGTSSRHTAWAIAG